MPANARAFSFRRHMPTNYSVAPNIDPPKYDGPNLSTPTPKLSADDAIDNTEDFKNSVRHAWDLMQQGRANSEAGFSTDSNGKARPIQVAANDPKTNNGHLSIHVQPDDTTTLHTHPDADNAYPSDDDIKAAKKSGKPIYMQSRQGLFHIDAKGKVTPLRTGTGWLYEKKKPSGQFANTPYSLAKK
jgi:hypothetical protein